MFALLSHVGLVSKMLYFCILVASIEGCCLELGVLGLICKPTITRRLFRDKHTHVHKIITQ